MREVRGARTASIAPTLRPLRAIVQWLAVSVLALSFGSVVHAATVVTFVAVRSGDTLTVSNPHASALSGHVRLVPDAPIVPPPLVPFSLPPDGSQSFPDVLSRFGGASEPAILAIEGTDTVTVATAPLRVAHANRPLTLPVRFNPAVPSVGSFIVGILGGSVRVDLYERSSSTAPLATRLYTSEGEQVTRRRYVDLLPPGMAITDGYLLVTPVNGQAVAVTVNAPMRRRAVRQPGATPPILSVSGSPACAFATGVRASVPSSGATHTWTLLNATAQGSLTGSAVDLALGSAGYATLVLHAVNGSSAVDVEANVRIDGRPDYGGSSASSVTLGDDVTIDWALSGGVPDTQTLTGTDFATGVTLDASATSYMYRPTTTGTKDYALNAENDCGSDSRSGSYTVSAACISPDATITASNGVCISSTGNTASVPSAGVGASYNWSISGGTITGGTGTNAITYTAGTGASLQLNVTVTKSAGCASSSSKNVTENPNPVSTITPSGPTTFCQGGTVTLQGPAGMSSYQYYRNGVIEPGATLQNYAVSLSGSYTLVVTNASGCSDVSDPVVVTATPNVTGSITSSAGTINFGEGATLTITVTDGTGWNNLTSSLGNSFSAASGAGSGTFTVTYNANNNTGLDTISVTINGACGGPIVKTVNIQVN